MSKYYYNKIIPHYDENVLLYQIHPSVADTRSWYFRFRTSKGKYVRRSLKTTNKGVAEEKARDLWRKIIADEERGITYTDKTFVELFKRFIKDETYQNAANHRRMRLQSFFNHIISREDCPLSKRKASKLNRNDWIDYLVWRSNLYANATDEEINAVGTIRTPAIRTLEHERNEVRMVLKWAQDKELLDKLPSMPKLTRALAAKYSINVRWGKTRGVAPESDVWDTIMRELRKWAFWERILVYNSNPEKYESQHLVPKSDVDQYLSDNYSTLPLTSKEKFGGSFDRRSTSSQKRFARKRLFYLIRISQATLLRPTAEIGSCRWKDLRFVESKLADNLLIPILTTYQAKRSNERMKDDRTRHAVGTYGSIKHFLTWRQICFDYGFGRDEDFIFPRWTTDEQKEAGITLQMPMGELGRTFSLQLKRWGLDQVPTGEKITLYSSRHDAITRRIQSGQTILDIATNAGTSIQTISQTYAKAWTKVNADRYSNTFGNKELPFSDEWKARIASQVESLYDERNKRRIVETEEKLTLEHD